MVSLSRSIDFRRRCVCSSSGSGGRMARQSCDDSHPLVEVRYSPFAFFQLLLRCSILCGLGQASKVEEDMVCVAARNRFVPEVRKLISGSRGSTPSGSPPLLAATSPTMILFSPLMPLHVEHPLRQEDKSSVYSPS